MFTASDERAIERGRNRIFTTKTKNMDDCYKELALFAKKIEQLALSIGNIGLSKIARQYKIEMKKAYDEYKRKAKNASATDAGPTTMSAAVAWWRSRSTLRKKFALRLKI